MNNASFQGFLGGFKGILKHLPELDDTQVKSLKSHLLDIFEEIRDEKLELKELNSFTGKNKFDIDKLQKFDIIYIMVGPVPHYCIVFKVLNELVYSIPISSKKVTLGMKNKRIEKSRMFNKSYFTSRIEVCDKQMAIECFRFIYDGNKKEFDDHLKEIKESYLKMLK